MDARDQEVVHSTPPQVINHGFVRVLKSPVQWLVIITLLISWAAAGIFMFDFVSDDQLTSKRLDKNEYINPSVFMSDDHGAQERSSEMRSHVFSCFVFIDLQHISSDPMTAVNEAVEGFTDKMNHLNDIYNNVHGEFKHLI